MVEDLKKKWKLKESEELTKMLRKHSKEGNNKITPEIRAQQQKASEEIMKFCNNIDEFIADVSLWLPGQGATKQKSPKDKLAEIEVAAIANSSAGTIEKNINPKNQEKDLMNAHTKEGKTLVGIIREGIKTIRGALKGLDARSDDFIKDAGNALKNVMRGVAKSFSLGIGQKQNQEHEKSDHGAHHTNHAKNIRAEQSKPKSKDHQV